MAARTGRATLEGKMDTQELNRHIEREVRMLQREFGGTIPEDEVAEISRKQLERLQESALFDDFIPLLVHRQTREILLEAEARRDARGDVVKAPA